MQTMKSTDLMYTQHQIMVCVSTKMMNELYKSGGQKVANKTRKTFKFNRRCQICRKKVKCLKYPGFIFLCPQKLSKNNPRKKTKSLNYPNTIPEILSEFGYVQDFFYVPRTIRGKKPNTLKYPNSIRYFGDLAKFSRILHENKFFYNLCFFCKNLAMFNSVLQSKQKANHCQICKIK